MALYAISRQRLPSDVMQAALANAGAAVFDPLRYPNPPFDSLSLPLFALGALVVLCNQVPILAAFMLHCPSHLHQAHAFACEHAVLLFQRLLALQVAVPQCVVATAGATPSADDIAEVCVFISYLCCSTSDKKVGHFCFVYILCL